MLCTLAFLISQAQAQTSEQQVLRPTVQTLMKATQEAYSGKNYDQALGFVNELLKISDLTSIERITTFRMRAAVENTLQNWDAVIETLEVVVDRKELSAIEKWSVLEGLISAAQKKKDYRRVVVWSRVYIDGNGPKSTIRTALVQALSAQNEHQQVVDQVNKFILADSRVQVKTNEQELKLMAIAYKSLNNEAGYADLISKLLSLYPSKIYWKEAVGNIARKHDFNTRLTLDLYRLLESADCLDDSDSYLEMVNHALKNGFPVEAQRVLQKGITGGFFANDDHVKDHNKLREDIQKRVQEDDKLPEIALSAQNSNGLFAIGELQLSKQNWQAAHDAFSKAAALGGVRRENELWLHDSIALFKLGQIAKALQQLKKIQGDETIANISKLWEQFIR